MPHSAQNSAPAPSYERGVYRSQAVVRGLVTYVAVTSMGVVLFDEVRSVKPGTVSEALAAARLDDLLNTIDPVIPSRPHLTLISPRHSSGASSSPPALG